MSKFKLTVSSFLITLALFSVACQAEEPKNNGPRKLPDSMLGKWQVTQVLFDQGGKETIQGLDDKYLIPKYQGRIFSLASNRLSINTPKDPVCEEPKLTSRKSTAAEVIAKSISSRLFDKSHPTTKDMQLPLADDAVVDVMYLTCKGILRSKDRDRKVYADLSNALWFIDLGNNQLAMSWQEQSVLILSRVANNAKPVASFNCAKAGTDVEKAICGSVGLAAYDKSLAQTYKLVKTYYKSKPDNKKVIAELKTSQREWLPQRDRCGNDVACLEKVMSIRISDLIYDLGDYMYQNR